MNKTVLMVILLLSASLSQAQVSHQEKNSDKAAHMAWWQEARFGMFVHWGIYSVTGGTYNGKELPNSAEWMMNRGQIPIKEYEQYAARFNPTRFNADEFVGLAKEAGMKYLVITAKHHDGFSMFGSKSSSYNVVDFTPFKRDIMKELAAACQKQGIRLGFYYSQCQDWHHPGGIGNNWDKSLKRVNFDEYVREKAVPEVTQLLTEYGPIAIFWWDTPRDMSEESFNSLHSLTKLQPDIITNDRLGKNSPGDHKTFERTIPKEAPDADYWEVCMPISGSWGYKSSDKSFKSIPTLIQNLVDIASKGGNYLLNVSPTAEGILLPESVERLKAIGRWMKVNGESIYNTTASPFGRLEWGRCTKKESVQETTLYLHVFDWPENGTLLVPGLRNQVENACLLADGTSLETQKEESGVVIFLPGQAPDDSVSVVVVKVSGTLEIASSSPMLEKNGSLVLTADTAYIHNNEGSTDARIQQREEGSNIGYWMDAQAWVEWSFKIDQPGKYQIWGELSIESEKSCFRVGLPDQQISVEVLSTGGYGNYAKQLLGEISFEKSGMYTLRVTPEKTGWQPINLRNLEIKKVNKQTLLANAF